MPAVPAGSDAGASEIVGQVTSNGLLKSGPSEVVEALRRLVPEMSTLKVENVAMPLASVLVGA